MPLDKYLKDVQKQLKTGIAREHAYRPALKVLLEEICPQITATNDPARIKCGAPDFILSRGGIDVGYIEAKDVGANLDAIETDEQLTRYRESLDNFILTDYLEFRLYLHGEKIETIRLADVVDGAVESIPENHERLLSMLAEFSAFTGQTIKSAKKLAEMMARKARLMRDIFYRAVEDDREESSLHDQLKAFRRVLVHDMDEMQFADVYAQTIAYGLFTARIHDETPGDFSRSEAMGLIPKSNPFLRQLFHYIAGPDLDSRVAWIVDALCTVFRATDLQEVLKDFGSGTGQSDPVLHFYETFLANYDAALRKAKGVWYTPEPVVHFIVRAIDDVLANDFGVKKGLADTSTVKIQVESQTPDRRTKSGVKMIEKDVHQVQILDVATGTGTFLADAVKHVFKGFKGQEGLWSKYVEEHLLPRFHGFELLMASYAMCHMKLDLLLQETNYLPSNPNKPPRLSVYLTNSLEEHHRDYDTLFASWLSRESNNASYIKKNMPIMVAMGNPPYSGESGNTGDWIMDLISVYKQEPGGGKLQERNYKWLNDDYVKFIRLGEHYIEKNGDGVLAYITNHAYLDNPTFRGMRWHLLQTFDDIYILDLHGNTNKKEKAPDGSADKNVFDILPGVAIIIAVRKKSLTKKNGLGTVHHAEVWGERLTKYDFLDANTLDSTEFSQLDNQPPYFFFVPKQFAEKDRWEEGISVTDLFPVNSVGIATARDKLTIRWTEKELVDTVQEFAVMQVEEAREVYDLGKDVQDWTVADAQKDLNDAGLRLENVVQVSYRPFDKRWTYYTGHSKGFHCRPRPDVMKHMLAGDNIGLLTSRMTKGENFAHVLVTTNISEVIHLSSKTSNNAFLFPLYLYESILTDEPEKVANVDKAFLETAKEVVEDITPESLFDYVYGVLHAPQYRALFGEFLKIEFPRIPYPSDAQIFHRIAGSGAELRGLHLMEDPKLDDPTTTYPIDGDHVVGKYRFEDGKVWVNSEQYFGDVPKEAWDLHIGGYQPAQKWLKDRKGRTMSIDDIQHYQKIVTVLTETDRIIKSIGDISFLGST